MCIRDRGRELTRVEFVTVLCRMFSWDTVTPESPSFSDCPASHWAYSYVETALAHGVMDAGGAFRPEDYISREEMAVMLVRALGYNELAGQLTDLSLPFDDVTENQGYIAIAYDIGMITGVEGAGGQLKFLPYDSATREEAAAMLVRVYERYTSRVDWLHGFYAFSSYSQIDLTASMDTNDFFTEAHPKLRPVESPTAGVFLSGVCQGPKDIPETVAQAGAAASKVIGLLAKDHLVTNPCVAHSNELLCNGCSQCEKVCPYGAITYVDKEVRGPGVREVRRIAQVNEAVCQGCGACTVTCPSGAMDLKGFANRQIIAEVDAICKAQ